MKKYIFLTFLLFSFFINAEIYWFLGFDNNYYLSYTQFSVTDSPFTIKTDSLDNILFAVLIDNHLNSNVFYGSDYWNVSNRTVSLHTSPSKFLLNSTFSFGDIISETSTITFDSIRMISGINTFDNKGIVRQFYDREKELAEINRFWNDGRIEYPYGLLAVFEMVE